MTQTKLRPNRFDCIYCLSMERWETFIGSLMYPFLLGVVVFRGENYLALPKIIIILATFLLMVSLYWLLYNAWGLGSYFIKVLSSGPLKHECRYFKDDERIEVEDDAENG